MLVYAVENKNKHLSGLEEGVYILGAQSTQEAKDAFIRHLKMAIKRVTREIGREYPKDVISHLETRSALMLSFARSLESAKTIGGIITICDLYGCRWISVDEGVTVLDFENEW